MAIGWLIKDVAGLLHHDKLSNRCRLLNLFLIFMPFSIFAQAIQVGKKRMLNGSLRIIFRIYLLVLICWEHSIQLLLMRRSMQEVFPICFLSSSVQ